MRSISQRELRNDNASVIRAVEAGESFIVTKNGAAVAVLRPATAADIEPGLPLTKPASRRVDYQYWPRVPTTLTSEQILAELRGDR